MTQGGDTSRVKCRCLGGRPRQGPIPTVLGRDTPVRTTPTGSATGTTPTRTPEDRDSRPDRKRTPGPQGPISSRTPVLDPKVGSTHGLRVERRFGVLSVFPSPVSSG